MAVLSRLGYLWIIIWLYAPFSLLAQNCSCKYLTPSNLCLRPIGIDICEEVTCNPGYQCVESSEFICLITEHSSTYMVKSNPVPIEGSLYSCNASTEPRILVSPPVVRNVIVTAANFSAMYYNAAASFFGGDRIRLTTGVNQKGTAYAGPYDFAGGSLKFNTAFRFILHDGDGISGRDGFTFVIHTTGPTAAGNTGGGLGLRNAVQPSFGIEFDTFSNAEVSDNHISIQENTNPKQDFDLTQFDMNNGTDYCVWIAMTSSTDVSLSIAPQCSSLDFIPPNAVQTAFILSEAPELILGNMSAVYIGFTASSLGYYNLEDILEWQYSLSATFP